MRKARALAIAAIVALLITAYGQGLWGAMVLFNLKTSPAFPWAVPVMAALLWLMWQYLGGRWAPASNSRRRRELLRAHHVSGSVIAWSLLAGSLAIVALAGLWIVLAQLVPMLPNALPSFRGIPLWTLVLVLLTSSIAAPLSEEAAFRGYALGILERHFRPVTALVLSSVLFALVHGPTQGFLWPKLLVYFLAGLVFGAVAQRAGSIWASIPVHMLADLTFFTCVWPYDAARHPYAGATDTWFWIHAAQALVFGVLALLAFRKMGSATAAQPNGGLALQHA